MSFRSVCLTKHRGAKSFVEGSSTSDDHNEYSTRFLGAPWGFHRCQYVSLVLVHRTSMTKHSLYEVYNSRAKPGYLSEVFCILRASYRAPSSRHKASCTYFMGASISTTAVTIQLQQLSNSSCSRSYQGILLHPGTGTCVANNT